jgi:hypothetical protein
MEIFVTIMQHGATPSLTVLIEGGWEYIWNLGNIHNCQLDMIYAMYY